MLYISVLTGYACYISTITAYLIVYSEERETYL